MGCAVERPLLVGEQASEGVAASLPPFEFIEQGLCPNGLAPGRRRQLENRPKALCDAPPPSRRAVERARVISDQASAGFAASLPPLKL